MPPILHTSVAAHLTGDDTAYRAKLLRFVTYAAQSRIELYGVRIGRLPVGFDALTTERLAEHASTIWFDYRFRQLLARRNRAVVLRCVEPVDPRFPPAVDELSFGEAA